MLGSMKMSQNQMVLARLLSQSQVMQKPSFNMMVQQQRFFSASDGEDDAPVEREDIYKYSKLG